MAVPLPQYDPVLMREHLFRDTHQLDAVLSDESNAFRPIKEAGLGLFNYRLVKMDSVSENEGLRSVSFNDIIGGAIKFTQTAIVDVLLLVLVVALVILLVSWLYPKYSHKKKFLNKEKNDASDADLENQLSSSANSLESTQFEKAEYYARSSASSQINSDDTLPCLISSALNFPMTPTGSAVEKFRTPKTPTGMNGIANYTRLPETVEGKLLMNRLRID